MKKTLSMITKVGAMAGLLLSPVLMFAQETPAPTPSSELELDKITAIVNELLKFIDSTLVPVIFAIAFIVFIWGVFSYFIAGAADEEKRKSGKNFVFWGLIGFVIMISLWGIVNLLVNTLGFDAQSKPCLPTFEGPCR